jgi:rsbT co-antagonist protein RsbR
MRDVSAGRLAEIISRNEQAILQDWLRRQSETLGRRAEAGVDPALRQQSAGFLSSLARALPLAQSEPGSSAFQPVRDVLEEVAAARAQQGYSPSETATFVFSLKQPIFDRLRSELGDDAEALGDAVWTTTLVLDAFGLYTTEIYQKNRDATIRRQSHELLELSTPVVQLWTGVLALPLIGTLDSARTQVVMESLLQHIVDDEATVAIIDITGVPTVDTMVAQHLLKTVAAARLMGADCIISGIRPQIAQTIVHLGVELGDVVTKASLADALKLALRRTGYVISRAQGNGAAAPSGPTLPPADQTPD